MATNQYFNHLKNKSEQDFYEKLVIENIKISGIDIYYIPRDVFEIDPILGEPKRSSFNSSYKIEVYFKNVNGYDGQGDLMSKFGLLVQDDASFIISRKRFRELQIPKRQRPLEGDLIYVGDIENNGVGTFTNSFFEITHVEHENPFYQLGKYFVYEVKCQLFTYGYEKFATNNQSIDNINSETNDVEISIAINKALKSKSQELIDFSEKNPFGDL